MPSDLRRYSASMAMTGAARADLLSQWIKPSSDDEKTQQDRAERMVALAIRAHAPFDGVEIVTYTKGSYPNNTNVRRDSDVDVVVELHECLYYGYNSAVAPLPTPPPSYSGRWTAALWRSEVTKSLVNSFGSGSVRTDGKIAINIPAVPGSRPSADVVPSFLYHRYDNATRTAFTVGSCVYTTDGAQVVNWPEQQLTNGRLKNLATGQRYKSYVRALKNAENRLVSVGTIKQLPSYFMECLIFNVPNTTLTAGSLDLGFKETLRFLWLGLDDGSAYTGWVEPNECKYLFRGDQKWTVDEAKSLVLATWNYLAYSD